MEKSSNAEVLRMIACGEVDLDVIADTIRSADLVIKSCQAEIESLKLYGEQLELQFQQERHTADELTRRLAALHEENRLAKQIFRSEIEGKRQILGVQMTLDLEALDMAGLIRERENAQKALGKTLGMGGDAAARR